MDDVQRKMRLRNRDVPINKGKANPNQPSSSSLNEEKGKGLQKEPFVSKEVEKDVQRDKIIKKATPVDVEKISAVLIYKMSFQS